MLIDALTDRTPSGNLSLQKVTALPWSKTAPTTGEKKQGGRMGKGS